MDEPASINIQGSDTLDARKDSDSVQHHPSGTHGSTCIVQPVSGSEISRWLDMTLDVSGPSRNAQSVGFASLGHQRESSKGQYCVKKRKCTCDFCWSCETSPWICHRPGFTQLSALAGIPGGLDCAGASPLSLLGIGLSFRRKRLLIIPPGFLYYRLPYPRQSRR